MYGLPNTRYHPGDDTRARSAYSALMASEERRLLTEVYG